MIAHTEKIISLAPKRKEKKKKSGNLLIYLFDFVIF